MQVVRRLLGAPPMTARQVARWGLAALLVATTFALEEAALAGPADEAAQEAAKSEPEREAAAERAEERADEEERKKKEEEEDDYGVTNSWEVGGSFSFLWQSDRYTIEMSPQVGYFFYDGFEVSAIFTMGFINEEIEGTSSRESSQSYAFILEPSYHIKVVKQLYIPIGLGTGVGYDGDNVDFEIIPRTGLDIVFTHHGVLHPSVRVPILIDSDDVTVQVGTTITYTVAF